MTTTVERVAELIANRDQKCSQRFLDEFGDIPNNEIDEIVALNRFWLRQLATLKVSTISERECLLDTLSADDWLRHFSCHVLPTAIRHQLPN